mmetsp:Transcript_132453/g.411766  ORF Transcript_132453/g.411766 Transcript_132453/m.411766 type:complete len:444 (+) Transcript_132453:1072-2403(+)
MHLRRVRPGRHGGEGCLHHLLEGVEPSLARCCLCSTSRKRGHMRIGICEVHTTLRGRHRMLPAAGCPPWRSLVGLRRRGNRARAARLRHRDLAVPPRDGRLQRRDARPEILHVDLSSLQLAQTRRQHPAETLEVSAEDCLGRGDPRLARRGLRRGLRAELKRRSVELRALGVDIIAVACHVRESYCLQAHVGTSLLPPRVTDAGGHLRHHGLRPLAEGLPLSGGCLLELLTLCRQLFSQSFLSALDAGSGCPRHKLGQAPDASDCCIVLLPYGSKVPCQTRHVTACRSERPAKLFYIGRRRRHRRRCCLGHILAWLSHWSLALLHCLKALSKSRDMRGLDLQVVHAGNHSSYRLLVWRRASLVGSLQFVHPSHQGQQCLGIESRAQGRRLRRLRLGHGRMLLIYRSLDPVEALGLHLLQHSSEMLDLLLQLRSENRGGLVQPR